MLIAALHQFAAILLCSRSICSRSASSNAEVCVLMLMWAANKTQHVAMVRKTSGEMSSRSLRQLAVLQPMQIPGLSYLYIASKLAKTAEVSFHSLLGSRDCKACHASSLDAGKCVCRSTRNFVHVMRPSVLFAGCSRCSPLPSGAVSVSFADLLVRLPACVAWLCRCERLR